MYFMSSCFPVKMCGQEFDIRQSRGTIIFPMEQVVIIGTGCAGLTAAIYTARANLSPLVLTGTQPGGLLTTTSIVENFPGFPEGIDGCQLMQNLQKQAEKFGARISPTAISTASISPGNRSSLSSMAIPSRPGPSSSPLAPAPAASGSTPNARSKNSASPTAPPATVPCRNSATNRSSSSGEGTPAVEEATYLTRFASKVYLVHRRDSLRASVIMEQRALNHPKIEMVWNSVVTEVLDVAAKKVTGVKLKNVVTGATSEIACRGALRRHRTRPERQGLRRRPRTR